MGNVVFTLVLAFRADSARAHCLRVCKFFPQGTPSPGWRFSDHRVFALPRVQCDRTGEFGVGRRQTSVRSAREPAGLGLCGDPAAAPLALEAPKGGSGQPHPGGGTTGPGLLSQRKGPASRGDAGTRGGRGAGARILGGCARPCAKAAAAAEGAGSRGRSSVLVTEQSWQRLSVFCRMRMFLYLTHAIVLRC